MKDEESPVTVFLSILGNPLLRFLIRFSGKVRLEDGKTFLEAAINDLAGEDDLSKHSLNRMFFSSIVQATVRLGCVAFNVEWKDAINSLRIPYFRKGLLNILGGIGEYGVTRPISAPAPFLVVWNFTNACNLRCRHCYQRADRPGPDELKTEECFQIVDQLDENNVSALAFSGGEPLAREDFFDVAEYAHSRGLHVSVATNGTLLTKYAVSRMKEAGVDYVEVSLDGASKGTHESFRGVRGSFDATIRGIKNCVEGGIYTCIATTATKLNLQEIPKIIELAKSLGVERIIVFNFIPTGRGEEIANLDLSPEERESLLKLLYKVTASGEIEALSTAPQYSRVCLQQSHLSGLDLLSPTHFAAVTLHGRTKQLADFIGGCGAGRLYCAIQPNGQVTPCVFMPIVVGDLRKQSLKEVWLKSKVLRELRDRSMLEGRCGHCKYKYVCGGCRARAYAYYGDYLAPDPGCIREVEEPSIQFSRRIKVELIA